MHNSEMTYKEITKTQGSIIARYRILRETRRTGSPKQDIADKYGMHRNTIRDIEIRYEEYKTEEIEYRLKQ